MSKILVTGTIVALFAAVAAALPDGAKLASAQDAAAHAGFAAAESTSPNVATPKSSPAAGQPSVVITSFNLTGNNSHVGELCGRVTGSTSDYSIVRVSVDPGEKNPGIYNTLAGADGSFCTVVVTYTGQAEASVKGMDKPFAATAGSSGR